jgi:hypothetical protein
MATHQKEHPAFLLGASANADMPVLPVKVVIVREPDGVRFTFAQ